MSEKPFVPIAPPDLPKITPIPKEAGGASERPHHPYSPSTLESLEACPLFKSRQNEKPHARTVAGTKAHKVADTEVDDSTLSDEDAAAVAECLDYVAGLREQLNAAAKVGEPILEFNELYLPIDDLEFTDAISTTAGYVDKVLVSHDKKVLHLPDYKFGMWPVTNAKDNLQGLAYALGAFKRWPTAEEAHIHFLQPHLQRITSATIFRSEIPTHYFRICLVVDRARRARQSGTDDAATPHAPICAFCAHLGDCKKALAVGLKVGNKFYPLEIPDDITPTKVLDPHSTDLAMRLSMVVAAWAKSFRSVLTDRVIRGDADIPEGFELVSQSRRELVDMAAYRKEAIKIIGAKGFEQTLQTTFGAVEEQIAEKAPRGMKKKIVQQFQKITEDNGSVTRGLPITFLKAVPKKELES